MAQTDPRKKKAQVRAYHRALIALSHRYPEEFRKLRLAEKAYALGENLDVNLPSGPNADLTRRHVQTDDAEQLALPMTANDAHDLLVFLQAALRRSSQLGMSPGRRTAVAAIARRLSLLVNKLPAERE